MATQAREAGSSLALGQNDSNAAALTGSLMLITGSNGQLYMSLINKKWGNNEYLINAVWREALSEPGLG